MSLLDSMRADLQRIFGSSVPQPSHPKFKDYKPAHHLLGQFPDRLAAQARKLYSSVLPAGSYDYAADRADRERAESNGLAQAVPIVVPVTAAGILDSFNPLYCDCNGVLLIPRTMDNDGNIIESSDTARLMIRVNDPTGPWLPFSFNLQAEGMQKSDNIEVAGAIWRMWIRVANATQDPDNQPNMILLLLRAISMSGQYGGSGLYSSPNNSGSAQAGQASAVFSPSAPTSSGVISGGGSDGGGGITGPASGGGGTGGGGGGGVVR